MVPSGGRRAVACGVSLAPALSAAADHALIVVGEPAAVESERDPGWQVHTGDRLGGEVLGGEDDQVRRAAAGVVHEGEDIAVVFGRAGHR